MEKFSFLRPIFSDLHLSASAMFFSLFLFYFILFKKKKSFGNKSEEFPETGFLVGVPVMLFSPRSGYIVYVNLSPCFPIH